MHPPRSGGGKMAGLPCQSESRSPGAAAGGSTARDPDSAFPTEVAPDDSDLRPRRGPRCLRGSAAPGISNAGVTSCIRGAMAAALRPRAAPAERLRGRVALQARGAWRPCRPCRLLSRGGRDARGSDALEAPRGLFPRGSRSAAGTEASF